MWAATCAVLAFAASCSTGSSGVATGPVLIGSGDATNALGDVWIGTRNSVGSLKDAPAGSFSIPLNYTAACPSGGQRTYQGTLAGNNSGGSGSATLAMSASLTNCAFGSGTSAMTISASNVTVNGAVAIVGGSYQATSLHLTATDVTITNQPCPGGFDVMLKAAALGTPPTATGQACGLTVNTTLP